jgi:hypothetical protein
MENTKRNKNKREREREREREDKGEKPYTDAKRQRETTQIQTE